MIIETGSYKQTWFSNTKYKEINLYSKTVYYFNFYKKSYRKYGPSMIYDNGGGSKYWIDNNIYHRNDGPAWSEFHSGRINNAFFFKDIRISEQEYWNM